jgi:hypothetical protein
MGPSFTYLYVWFRFYSVLDKINIEKAMTEYGVARYTTYVDGLFVFFPKDPLSCTQTLRKDQLKKPTYRV